MADFAQPAPLSPHPLDPVTTLLQKLAAMDVDYSVKEANLRSCLGNATCTPYPAMVEALLATGCRLKLPVYLDVIMYYYEATPGIRSARRSADVQITLLRNSVLSASNKRYGTNLKAFDTLFK